MFFYSCNDENIDQPEPMSMSDLSSQDVSTAIELFAISVAKASNHEEFRSLIRNETNKQFDYDYNVLYRFIMDNDFYIKGQKYSSVESFLCSQIDKEIKHSAFETHDNYINTLRLIKNLNICVPFQYENWDYKHAIPDVAILDQQHIKSTGYANCYDKEGNPFKLHKKDGHPYSPIITVGISERVDDEGFLVVDAYGFMLENSADKISADYAYLMASSNLKSGNLIFYPQIWEVKDDDFFKNIEEPQEIKNIDVNLKSSYLVNDSAIIPTLETPKITIIHPALDEIGAIYLEWSSVPNATHYDIFRRYGQADEWVWCGDVPSSYSRTLLNRYCNMGDVGYYYEVRAKNVNTNEISPRSATAFTTASWRKGRATERIEFLTFNSAALLDFGFLESRLEFYAMPVLYDKSEKSIEYPRRELGSYWLPTQPVVMNRDLFLWNVSKHASNYFLWIYESDGGWSVEVNMGVKVFFNESKNVEASASVKFSKKSLDDVVGNVEVHHYLGGYLNLSPPAGQAYVNIVSN